MKSWSHGYVADVPYVEGYYGHQAPLSLRLAALVAGFEAPETGAEYCYCELGCGQGLTSTVLAAANPHAQFFAVDFNPAHIAQALDVVRRHKIQNLTFLENSVEELCLPQADHLPQFDFITLHGLYSWVSPQTKASIVDFVRRKLKPGGLVYVSYNSLPGWSSVIPLQRLIFELAGLAQGRSDARLADALGIVARMRDAGGVHLGGDTHLQGVLDMLARGAGGYLVHEYINEWWRPVFHMDVVRDFSAAKLDYVGSAVLLDNFPTLSMSDEQRQIWDTMPNPEMREMVRDHFVLKLLRKDVFVRGARRLTTGRQEEMLRQMRLVMTVGKPQLKGRISAPVGVIELEPGVYGPMFEALASGAQTVGELMDIPAVKGRSRASAVEVVSLLTASGQIVPALPQPVPCSDAAISLNAEFMAVAGAAPMGAQHVMVVPALGGGGHFSTVECIVFDGLSNGVSRQAIEDQLLQKADATGAVPLGENGERLGAEDVRARLVGEIDEAIKRFHCISPLLVGAAPR